MTPRSLRDGLVFVAEHPGGACGDCHQPFQRGDRMVARHGRWCHRDCPHDQGQP